MQYQFQCINSFFGYKDVIYNVPELLAENINTSCILSYCSIRSSAPSERGKKQCLFNFVDYRPKKKKKKTLLIELME